MPRRDQTGPEGIGPMTGRRMGECAGNQQQESIFNFGFGRGFHGRRNMRFTSSHNRRGSFEQNQYSNTSKKDLIESEIDTVKKRLQFLEDELKNIS